MEKNDGDAFMGIAGFLVTIVLIAWAVDLITKAIGRLMDAIAKWWETVWPSVLVFLEWSAFIIGVALLIYGIYKVFESYSKRIDALTAAANEAMANMETKVSKLEGRLNNHWNWIANLRDQVAAQEELIKKLKNHTSYQEIQIQQDSAADNAIKELTGGT